MSALAELIDREFLAARAPIPVTYMAWDMEMDINPTNWKRSVFYLMQGRGRARFRMSDGSLVIVRRKL